MFYLVMNILRLHYHGDIMEWNAEIMQKSQWE
jgi:hypothetical protein